MPHFLCGMKLISNKMPSHKSQSVIYIEKRKIGPRGGHVWLMSYPGPRGFSCLFAALVLSSHAEKNQENPLGPGYLRVDFLCIIGYKKIDPRTRLVQV